MSEYDSGSGRKGFVRDVMRRITPANPRDDEGNPTNEPDPRQEADDLRDAMKFFGTDSTEFRRRLDRLMAEIEALRRR